MLGPESYKIWTSPFTEGSYYEGSWEQWAKINFLSPAGGGMMSVIEENNPYKFLSIKHIGFIKDWVEDTESSEVKAWAGAHENYTFTETNGVTTLQVAVDTAPEWEKDMSEAWPKALEKLKNICE